MEVSKSEYDLLLSHVLATESHVQSLKNDIEQLKESRNKWIERCLELTEHAERMVYDQGKRVTSLESELEEVQYGVYRLRKFYVPKKTARSHWWQFWK